MRDFTLVLLRQETKRVYIPAIVDFPTPPLADDTATIFFTSGIDRFSGRPRFIRAARFGGVPFLGSPF